MLNASFGITISIHAPLAGSDVFIVTDYVTGVVFQSTLPLRGATKAIMAGNLSSKNFNPRSPCGERLGNQQTMQLADIFQSTLPLRGATHRRMGKPTDLRISIHAPLAGSDIQVEESPPVHGYFNPRSPCGERLAAELAKRLND